MKKINKVLLLLLFSFLFALTSCGNKYSTPAKLKKDFIVDYNETYSTNEDDELFATVGKYGDGYLLVRYIVNPHDMGSKMPDFIAINNIEIICFKTTYFYYYLDHEIYEGLENIYNLDYLNDDDLNDIKNKFASWADKHYVIGEDYPIA